MEHFCSDQPVLTEKHPRSVRRFLLKCVLFFGPLLILLNLIAARLPDTNYGDIFRAIRAAEVKSDAHTLILGDSVGRQMFAPEADVPDCRVITTNQAISMTGQYILAARVLESGTPIRSIVLLMIPRSFRNDLDQPRTFNYFVREFYRSDFKQYLSPLVYQRLRRKPYWIVAMPMIRKTWLGSEIDYSDNKPERSDNFFSPVSIEYLQKLRDLAESRHVRFRVMSSAISRKQNVDFDMMKRQIRENGLDDVFADYFDKMEQLPNDDFEDGIHYGTDALVAKNRQAIQARINTLSQTISTQPATAP